MHTEGAKNLRCISRGGVLSDIVPGHNGRELHTIKETKILLLEHTCAELIIEIVGITHDVLSTKRPSLSLRGFER